MPDIYSFAAKLVRSKPDIANSPMGKNFLQALDNRDNTKGEEMANNFLNNQGFNKETAMEDVKQNIKNLIPNIPFF